MGEVHNYFKTLYSPGQLDERSIQDFIHIVTPKLTAEDNDGILSEISNDDVLETVLNSPLNKSPGPDGLPIEFYVKYWPIIGDKFTCLVNEILNGNTIPEDFKESKIVLIPKSNTKKSLNNFAQFPF